jgi:hypothetical protein
MKYKQITLIIFLISFLICLYFFINGTAPTFQYVKQMSSAVPLDSIDAPDSPEEVIFEPYKLNGAGYLWFIIKNNHKLLSLGWIAWGILLIYSGFIFIKRKVKSVGFLVSLFRCHAYYFAFACTFEFFDCFSGHHMDGPSKALFLAELALLPLIIQLLFYGIISLLFISLVSIKTNVTLKFSLFDIVSLAVIYFDLVLIMLFAFWGIYLYQ